jgi:hypothetical protein
VSLDPGSSRAASWWAARKAGEEHGILVRLSDESNAAGGLPGRRAADLGSGEML